MLWQQRLDAEAKGDEPREIKPMLYQRGLCGLGVKIALAAIAVGHMIYHGGWGETNGRPSAPQGWRNPTPWGAHLPVINRLGTDPIPLQDRDWIDIAAAT